MRNLLLCRGLGRKVLTTTAYFICFSPGLCADNIDTLTVDRIFGKHEFDATEYGPILWDNSGQSYTLQEPSKAEGGKDIVRVNALTGVKSIAVSARVLRPPGSKSPLNVQSYEWSRDNQRVLLFANSQKVWRDRTRGDYWAFDLASKKLKKLGGNFAPATLMFAKLSPDGKSAGYVHNNNIYVEDISGGKMLQLTRDGSHTTINGTSDWVYEEELGVRDCWRWSPDGKRIAYWQFDSSGVRDFTLVNDTDSLYPTIKIFGYPKAGEKNSAARIGVVSSTGGPTRWIDLPGDPRENYIARMNWAENSTEVVIEQLDRLQHHVRVILANVGTGSHRTIFTEHDDCWLETWHDTSPEGLKWIEDGKAFLWMSERSGWRHIYRISRNDASFKPITHGEYDVDHFDAVDEKNCWVYYTASPGNPVQRYLFRARLNGSGQPEQLASASSGHWHGYSFAPGARWAIHIASSFGSAPIMDLVKTPDYRIVRTLEDNSTLRRRLSALRKGTEDFFRIEVGGGTSLDAWMIKPPDFDPSKRYPLLIHVYGEPAGITVTDHWIDFAPDIYAWHLMMAQQGYIVASIENRGTPTLRGRAWRRSIYKRIGSISSQDQANAVKELCRRSYIDASRVGIWGWSGGGSNTLNCLFRYPDVFKVGVAVAPVPDIRLYDTIYQERYMGLPQSNPEAYRKASPITFADHLKGDLLLIHGTGDDNVHFQGTERLINRLVELGKPFSLMVYPNRTHMHEEGEGTLKHLYGTMTRYFKERLPPGPAP